MESQSTGNISTSDTKSHTVSVTLKHSSIHARLFLPSKFDESTDQTLQSFSPLPWTSIPIRQEFRETEDLALIRDLAVEKIGLPANLFGPFTCVAYELRDEYEPKAWQVAPIDDSTTIGELKQRQKWQGDFVETATGPTWQDDVLEPEEIKISLTTLAGQLSDIIGLREVLGREEQVTDGLVPTMQSYRHYRSALAYQERTTKTNTDEPRRVLLAQREAKTREDCRRAAFEVAEMFNDWYRLGLGVSRRLNPHRLGDGELERCFDEYLLNRAAVLQEKKEAFQARTPATEQPPSPSLDGRQQQPVGLSRPVVTPMEIPNGEDYVNWNFPSSDESHSSHSFRLDSGALDVNLGSFEIRSGLMLWGQLHTVFAGSISTELQGSAASSGSALPGGTIRQRVLRYRSAARKGRWRVRRFSGDPYPFNTARADKFTGWIVNHEDFDPHELIDRCSLIATNTDATSLENNHADQDIFYVNRYDWSYHCRPGATNDSYKAQYSAFLDRTTGRQLPPELPEDGELLYQIREGYELKRATMGLLLALDAEEFSAEFMKSFCNECHPKEESDFKERVLTHGDRQYGTYVSHKHTEYELGWLVFSGQKHPDFPQDEEMAAIVYDASYSALGSHHWSVEGETLS